MGVRARGGWGQVAPGTMLRITSSVIETEAGFSLPSAVWQHVHRGKPLGGFWECPTVKVTGALGRTEGVEMEKSRRVGDI